MARNKKGNSTTVAILGANGFIGSHLVDLLAGEPGIAIKAVDRFSKPQVFKKHANVKNFAVDFFQDSPTFDDALKDTDYLIHCFSATNPFVSDENPYLDIEMLRRSVEIFEKAINNGVKKIVFVSSGGAVYGHAQHLGDASETTTPAPKSPYGIAKLAIEHYLEYFKAKRDAQYVVYRLTNPYGPRQALKRNQGAIPAFLDNIRNDREVMIYGDGTSSRDFIYIEDAVKMIGKTFLVDTEHTVYNIGSGRQTTLNEILDALRAITGKDIAVTYADEPKTFLKRTNVDINRFVEEFGDVILTDIQTGIKKTIQSLD